jgi:predicted transcriptional regulator
VAEVLSDQNRALLKVIRETHPDSLAVLAKAFAESYASRWISMETLNCAAHAAS